MEIFAQNPEIARMNAETVEAVAELDKLCFTSPWSLASLSAELSNPLAVFLTAIVDNEIVGYAGMHHIIDEGYVTNIAVLPAYRRRGVARALTEALLQYGVQNGLRIVTLEVRESNIAARELYKSLRFNDVGRRVNYYSRPSEDAILMTRELQTI